MDVSRMSHEIGSLREEGRRLAEKADSVTQAIEHLSLWVMTCYVTGVMALVFAFLHSTRTT